MPSSNRGVPDALTGTAPAGTASSLLSAHKLALLRSAAVQSRKTKATTRLRAGRFHQRIRSSIPGTQNTCAAVAPRGYRPGRGRSVPGALNWMRRYTRRVRRSLGLLIVVVMLFGLSTDANWCPDGCAAPGHAPAAGTSSGSGCVFCGFAALAPDAGPSLGVSSPPQLAPHAPDSLPPLGAVQDHEHPPRLA